MFSLRGGHTVDIDAIFRVVLLCIGVQHVESSDDTVSGRYGVDLYQAQNIEKIRGTVLTVGVDVNYAVNYKR